MNLNETTKRDGEFTIEIDWLNLLLLLWKKAWLIILLCAVIGSGAFVYTKVFVEPQYASSVQFYVNNKSQNNNNGSISASELSVAQSLVNTYIQILMTDDTFKEIQKSIPEVTVGELRGMISASGISDTEVFRVTVHADNPYKAQMIASSIEDALRPRIEDIIEGSSLKKVNSATINVNPVSPNSTRNAMIGAAVGAALACALIFIMALLDDIIHNEDYVINTYKMPVLAKIPDLVIDEPGAKYGRYSKRSYRSYYKAGYKKN